MVQQAAPAIKVNQQVDIARRIVFRSGDRTDQSNISCAVTSGDRNDFGATLPEQLSRVHCQTSFRSPILTLIRWFIIRTVPECTGADRLLHGGYATPHPWARLSLST